MFIMKSLTGHRGSKDALSNLDKVVSNPSVHRSLVPLPGSSPNIIYRDTDKDDSDSRPGVGGFEDQKVDGDRCRDKYV